MLSESSKYLLEGTEVVMQTEVKICGQDKTQGVPPLRWNALRLVLVACLFLAELFMPISAYAQNAGFGYGEIVYGPVANSVGGKYTTDIMVVAANNYDAAAYTLGYSRSQVGALELTQRAKMSDPNYGGRFYEYAQLFKHPPKDTEFDLDNPLAKIWDMYNAVYGNENLWFAGYSQVLHDGAKYDFETILNGGNVEGGGSGGSGENEEYVEFYGTTPYGQMFITPSSGVPTEYYPASQISACIRVGKDSTTYNNMLTRYNEGFTYFYALPANMYRGSLTYDYRSVSTLIQSNVELDILVQQSGTNNNKPAYTYQIKGVSTGKIYYYYYWQQNITVSSSQLIVGPSATSQSQENISASNYNDSSRQFGALWVGGPYDITGGGGVVPPDGDWPEDEPDAPEPPELPTPTDPTIEPPDPYQPTSGNTYIWNSTNVTEPADLTSITDWLSKIFQQLKAMQTDFNSWLQNLSNGQSNIRQAIDNAASQIYGAVNGLQSAISLEFSSLKTYLKGLFEWLSDSMQYENAGYDDSSVIYWLKRIWAKGGNGVNTRPVDPTTDPGGAWDWLLRLIENLTLNMAASLSDAVSELGDLLSQVITQFPFSIPWDIALFLTALASPPVTPQFTVSIPEIEGWWEQVDFVIDLSPYDTMAATVRTMEKIIFAGFLAWKSKELLSFMDPSTWE